MTNLEKYVKAFSEALEVPKATCPPSNTARATSGTAWAT